MGLGEKRRFRRDPLEFIEDLRRRSPRGVFQLPWGTWCVSDADLAWEVLRGPKFNQGPSPFFGEALPSRSAQVDFGRVIRETVRARIPEYRNSLVAAVADMSPVSQWPSAGPRLIYRAAADLLLHADAPAELRRSIERTVAGDLQLRPPTAWRRARAELAGSKLSSAAIEHVRERREDSRPAGTPRDVLDTVLDVCPEEVTDQTVTSLYKLMLMSIVATVGHSVAWSVLLACRHQPADSRWPWPVDWVVREALRHRPVVWMVGRRAPCPTEFGGITFQEGQVVSVSPYLLHHDEHRWTHPGVFRPERWAESAGHGPFLPFSSGPWICAGASVAHTLITEAVAALTHDARLAVTSDDTRPVVTNAAIARPFTLHRTTTNPNQDCGRR